MHSENINDEYPLQPRSFYPLEKMVYKEKILPRPNETHSPTLNSIWENNTLE